MSIKQYQIDAFATKVFEGNPATVCPLEKWLDDKILQAIAEENNLSETAFFVPSKKGFYLRWFAPLAEVDLCGHATLASAYVLFDILNYSKPTITFETKSGGLVVSRDGQYLTMDFPIRIPRPSVIPEMLVEGLGRQPIDVFMADDYIAVFNTEEEIKSIKPDFTKLKELDLRGVVVTAKGDSVDFVSRMFGPKVGITEDPVTGSSHCALAPYWETKLGKKKFIARQVSKRGGEVLCEVRGNRVFLSGRAVKFMEAEIYLGT